MKCVMIMVDDQGQASVGECPPDMMSEMMGGEGAEAKGGYGGKDMAGGMGMMKPAASVDEALQVAKGILGAPESQDQTWNKVSRDRQMASQPGGPMMGMK